jgi:peptide/nickel transport system substrate-binding protein
MSKVNWLAVVLLLAFASAGCGGADDREQSPRYGGDVVIGLLSDPKTLNPLVASSVEARNIIGLVYLTLLEEQGDFLSFEPRLARGWEFSSDSLAITFRLRDDARWQDGEPVTADDVRFTYELQTDTLVAWPGRNLKERIDNVEVLDRFTVRFRFSERYPYQLMDANDGVILPKHVLESIPRSEVGTAPLGRDPVGNGPFKLARWVSEQYIELERNPLYYEQGKPYLSRVIFRIVPDMTTLVTQLKSGEINCLESLPMDAVTEIKRNYPDVEIISYRSRHHNFVAWNLEKPPFTDVDIRRAFAMAVNTSEMIETLWGGYAEPSVGPMHPVLWAHDPSMTPIQFDPAGAKKILADKGWVDEDGDGVVEKNGRELEFEMVTNQGNQLRSDIMTMVQEYLGDIGVKVVPRTFEWNTFISRVVGGEYDSCVLGWKVATKADLTSFWHSGSIPPGGYNISRYRNTEVDSLIDLAKNTLDPEKARPIWNRCQRIIYDDQPILFLSIPHDVVGLARGYRGVEPNAISFFANIRDWKKTVDVAPR